MQSNKPHFYFFLNGVFLSDVITVNLIRRQEQMLNKSLAIRENRKYSKEPHTDQVQQDLVDIIKDLI